ncbi:hypothetical protein [Agarilytica rhodophyticola]|uniref:hypothetical protein n=1 Tax=Agarilytica rhodophyticola TaxID=1737490 RepID=UPI000B3476CF|nr:hypothetical protein [Agarilytica rhodophyticola]
MEKILRKVTFSITTSLLLIISNISLAIQSNNLIPIAGKWNGEPNTSFIEPDHIGLWNPLERLGKLDGNRDGQIDNITVSAGNHGDQFLSGIWKKDSYGNGIAGFALYRPHTRFFYFYEKLNSQIIYHQREAGNIGDIPLVGDWDGDGIDGFATYRPTTRTISFYQSIDSSEPFYSRDYGNVNDIPLVGDWNGDSKDSIAIYNPQTRQFSFYQELNTAPFVSHDFGDSGDIPIVGDWDGDGKDGIGVFRITNAGSKEFWLKDLFNKEAISYVVWIDGEFHDASLGIQKFYQENVPHFDREGNLLTKFDTNRSFIPRGIYNADPDRFEELDNAGFNLAMIWPTYYPLKDSQLNSLDNLPNFKVIHYFKEFSSAPLVGKFHNGSDSFGASSGNNLALDLDGDKKPDFVNVIGDNSDRYLFGDWNNNGHDGLAIYKPDQRQFWFYHDILGNETITVNNVASALDEDLPIVGDWDGDGRESFALYRPSTREIRFYQNLNASMPFRITTFGNPGDIIVAGNWDGQGADGIATYRPSTRRFWLYQDIYSEPFTSIDLGNHGDLPIAGDWNGDGTDNIGVYRFVDRGVQHEFWTLNNTGNNQQLSVYRFKNPMINLPESTKNRVFGFYTADEPINYSVGPQQTLNDLTSIYDAYSDINSQVFFHVNVPFVPQDSDPAIENSWKAFAKLGEITAHDAYPKRNTRQDMCEGGAVPLTSLEEIANTVSQARIETREAKPNWFVYQTFDSQDSCGNFDFDAPTEEELRAMVYTSIVHGATGLLSFLYHSPQINSELTGIAPDQGLTHLWQASKVLNTEIESLKEIILSPTSNKNYSIKLMSQNHTANGELPIRSLLKRHVDGTHTLITVNITNKAHTAIFQLEPILLPGQKVKEGVLSGTEIPTVASGFAARYEPFDVKIYRISATN